jgi:hypothetical protein
MDQFPQDYYGLPSATQALAARLGAIRQVLPRGSRVLDLGCNDARISLALLESGHAAHAIGYDRHPPSAAGHPGLELRCADLLTLDPAALPATDAVLLLNVAHHLLVRGAGFVQRLVAQLLARAPVVMVDMGSLTEPDLWPWRHLMGQLWPSDHAMWNELFSAARWRRVLATYPYQGGRRTLFKLVGPLEPAYRYRPLATYRRTVATNPEDKRLIEVQGEDDQPIPFGAGIGDLCPEVVFHLLQREETEERFWAKAYRGPRAHPDVLRVEEEVQRFVRTQPFAASTWLEVSPEHGFVYPYDPELFAGPVVHFYWRRKHFTARECLEIRRIGDLCLRDGPLAGLPLRVVCDLQVVRTRRGLVFLDFERGFDPWGRLMVQLVTAPDDVALRARLLSEVQRPLDARQQFGRGMDELRAGRLGHAAQRFGQALGCLWRRVAEAGARSPSGPPEP